MTISNGDPSGQTRRRSVTKEDLVVMNSGRCPVSIGNVGSVEMTAHRDDICPLGLYTVDHILQVYKLPGSISSICCRTPSVDSRLFSAKSIAHGAVWASVASLMCGVSSAVLPTYPALSGPTKSKGSASPPTKIPSVGSVFGFRIPLGPTASNHLRDRRQDRPLGCEKPSTHRLLISSTSSRGMTPFTCTTPFSANSLRISSSDAVEGMGLSHPSPLGEICPIFDSRSISVSLLSAMMIEGEQ